MSRSPATIGVNATSLAKGDLWCFGNDRFHRTTPPLPTRCATSPQSVMAPSSGMVMDSAPTTLPTAVGLRCFPTSTGGRPSTLGRITSCGSTSNSLLAPDSNPSTSSGAAVHERSVDEQRSGCNQAGHRTRAGFTHGAGGTAPAGPTPRWLGYSIKRVTGSHSLQLSCRWQCWERHNVRTRSNPYGAVCAARERYIQRSMILILDVEPGSDRSDVIVRYTDPDSLPFLTFRLMR